jgi:adenosylcobinamide-phosphate synthase
MVLQVDLIAPWLERAEPALRSPLLFLGLCLLLDVLLGDPPYRLHPVRVTGTILALSERGLRRLGLDGIIGGCLLFLVLVAAVGGGAWAAHAALDSVSWILAWLWDLYLGYSLLALGDLVRHGRRIAAAAGAGDLAGARAAAGMLVGRDTAPMDLPACNRAAIESLAESLVDGVLSPLFWLALLGLPGLVLFKIVSTMDSMVGYRNERYLRFGRCGARLDDAMNWIPARLSLLLIALFSAAVPGYSARKAWRVCLSQRRLLPGPNKGWSETAAAGALQVRLAGPIWKDGAKVNDLWIGDPADPEGGAGGDVARTIRLVHGTTAIFVILCWALHRLGWMARWA